MADKAYRAREVFISGLRNAHAMEDQALELLNRQVERVENYPKLKARLEQHVRETEAQIQRLDKLLDSLGESRSVLKDNLMSLSGNMAAVTHALTQDEVLKNRLANFAFENYEAASYESLIFVAQSTGHTAATQPLTQSLQEERAMAAWLNANLPDVTQTYLQRYATGQKAGL